MDHTVFALIGTLGVPELIIIFFILMLIFGANRLSGLGFGRFLLRGHLVLEPADGLTHAFAEPPRDA